MGKKLITACLGLVALAAFALPAVASAENKPVITHPTGTALATGAKLTATSIGKPKLKNDAGTETLMECNTAVTTGSLAKNSLGTIEVNITTATFFGGGSGAFEGMEECRGFGFFSDLTVTTNGTDPVGTKLEGNEDIEKGTPYCIRSTPTMATDEFQIRGGTCSEGARAITFAFDTTGLGTCRYTRTETIKGSFTTDTTGDAVMSIAPSGSTFTKDEPSGILCPTASSLEMTFTMETDTVATSPVYISKLP